MICCSDRSQANTAKYEIIFIENFQNAPDTSGYPH